MTTVLLVNRSTGNIRVMQRVLEESGYSGVAVGEESHVDAVVEAHAAPLVGVVDISGFGPEIWRVCERLRERRVPFVVLSTSRELRRGQQSLSHGASGILQKPVAKSALLDLIRTLAA